MTGREMTAEEFDEYFDNGGDITEFIDPASIRFPGREPDEQRRVSINMPVWLVDRIDAEAKHLAVNRQSYINMTLADSFR